MEHGVPAVLADDLDCRYVFGNIRRWETGCGSLERDHFDCDRLDVPVEGFAARAIVILDVALLQLFERSINEFYGVWIEWVGHRFSILFGKITIPPRGRFRPTKPAYTEIGKQAGMSCCVPVTIASKMVNPPPKAELAPEPKGLGRLSR